MNIFHGLSINSTVYMEKARIWITPFSADTDVLAMNGNDYQRGLAGNTSAGAMEITQAGGPELTKKDWNDVINMPAYKLDIDVSIHRHGVWSFLTDCFRCTDSPPRSM